MVKLAICALLLSASVAAADSPKIASARAAVEAVQYDDAQALLVAALNEGGNSPGAVAEIYRLQGTVSAVLDQRDVADQYFRRWIALDPNASLAADVKAKIREPFVSAQAFMNAHGRMSVTATRESSGVSVVIRDPVGLIRAIAPDAPGPPALQNVTGERLTISAAADVKRVFALDEHGNHLVEATILEWVAVKSYTPASKSISIVRSWKLWAALSGAMFLGASVVAMVAGSSDNDVQNFAFDGSHYYSEYEDARDSRDKQALVANGLWIGSGFCLATAIVMFVIRPTERSVAITPAAQGQGATVSVHSAF